MSAARKHELLELLVDKPFEFSASHITELLAIKGNDALTFKDMRKYVCRIFDINDNILLDHRMRIISLTDLVSENGITAFIRNFVKDLTAKKVK